jgi:ubiquitin-conjugating enzyme E2 M
MKTTFADPADLLNFTLTITPDEGQCCATNWQIKRGLTRHFWAGMYKGGSFKFSFHINTNYPHEPPKVKCIPKVRRVTSGRLHFQADSEYVQIYHPNVDLEGNVCLNILREDWKPVLNLNSVMVGLQYLFLEPNADDPLNKGMLTIANPEPY